MSEEKPKLGLGKLREVQPLTKKRYRWTFQLKENLEDGTVKDVGSIWIKLINQPLDAKTDLSFIKDEEVRRKLQNSVVSFLFYESTEADSFLVKEFYRFLSTVYPLDENNQTVDPLERAKKWDGVLTMYDACGVEVERWILSSLLPLSVRFGELDFTSNDYVTIETTLLYQRVEYVSNYTPPPSAQPAIEVQTFSGHTVAVMEELKNVLPSE